jgi:hypothetical protein
VPCAPWILILQSPRLSIKAGLTTSVRQLTKHSSTRPPNRLWRYSTRIRRVHLFVSPASMPQRNSSAKTPMIGAGKSKIESSAAKEKLCHFSTLPIALVSLRAVPAAKRDQTPHGFHNTEWPSALKKTVNRSQCTCDREGQNEPRAALFEGVRNQHRGHCEQSESCESIHGCRGWPQPLALVAKTAAIRGA